MVSDLLQFVWTNGLAFVFILMVVVFIHEFGHYWVARRAGVRIEVFSLGFGPEVWGWNDRHGTRWRISLLPLGGYVKMFGESMPTELTGKIAEGDEKPAEMSAEEKAFAFIHKSLPRRAAVVAAGPGPILCWPGWCWRPCSWWSAVRLPLLKLAPLRRTALPLRRVFSQATYL